VPVYALLTEKQTFFDANSNELSGGKLFVYLAGTTTKATSYAETDGVSPNSNPIVLNSRGEVPNGLYVNGGATYKLVLAPSTDTDPPTSPIWTRDNLTPTNDVSTSAAVSEWLVSPYVVSFSNGTTFTVSGDVTSVYQVGRRVRATIGSGNLYGTISSSVFAVGTTTVIVRWDSGAIDGTLTAVDYSLLSGTNSAVPVPSDAAIVTYSVGDPTKRLRFNLQSLTTASTRVLAVPDANITLTDRALTQSYAIASGTNTYTTGFGPIVTAYVTGGIYLIRFTNANTIAAPTLNIDSVGAATIVRQGGGALLAGDISANMYALLQYNGTQFVLLNPAVPAPLRFTSANQTITSAGTLTLAHGLPGTPTRLWYGLVNTSNEYGWSGEVLIQAFAPQDASATVARGATAWADATNVYVQYGSGAAVFNVHQRTGTPGLTSAATNANWRLRVYAEL